MYRTYTQDFLKQLIVITKAFRVGVTDLQDSRSAERNCNLERE